MKAEHRKELHTNALADRLGRVVKGVKTGVKSSSLAIWAMVVLALVALGAFLFFRSATNKARSHSWEQMDQVAREESASRFLDQNKIREQLKAIVDKNPGTQAALIARLQLARLNLQQDGLKLLPTQPKTALANLDKVRKEYEKLVPECKNDPYWAPQVQLALAEIVEAHALEDPANLKKAAALYQKVAEDYPESAAGKEAKERARQLKEDAKEVEAFYKKLGEEKPKVS